MKERMFSEEEVRRMIHKEVEAMVREEALIPSKAEIKTVSAPAITTKMKLMELVNDPRIPNWTTLVEAVVQQGLIHQLITSPERLNPDEHRLFESKYHWLSTTDPNYKTGDVSRLKLTAPVSLSAIGQECRAYHEAGLDRVANAIATGKSAEEKQREQGRTGAFGSDARKKAMAIENERKKEFEAIGCGYAPLPENAWAFRC